MPQAKMEGFLCWWILGIIWLGSVISRPHLVMVRRALGGGIQGVTHFQDLQQVANSTGSSEVVLPCNIDIETQFSLISLNGQTSGNLKFSVVRSVYRSAHANAPCW